MSGTNELPHDPRRNICQPEDSRLTKKKRIAETIIVVAQVQDQSDSRSCQWSGGCANIASSDQHECGSSRPHYQSYGLCQNCKGADHTDHGDSQAPQIAQRKVDCAGCQQCQ